MRRCFVLLLGIFLAGYLTLAGPSSIRAYPTGPVPAVTGGFGERTCNQSGCHVSFEVDAGKALNLGDIVIAGLPEQYKAGKTYHVTLTVSHTQERAAWGFQLAARVKATGRQAGELKPTDSTTQVVQQDGIQYIEHTLDGIPTNTFEFEWVAPGQDAGEVIMHSAGNAADGDNTPEGDYIYTTSLTVPSSGK